MNCHGGRHQALRPGKLCLAQNCVQSRGLTGHLRNGVGSQTHRWGLERGQTYKNTTHSRPTCPLSLDVGSPATFAATVRSGSLALPRSVPSPPNSWADPATAVHGGPPPNCVASKCTPSCSARESAASRLRRAPASPGSFSTAQPKGRATSFQRSKMPRCIRARRSRAAC